MKSPSRKKLREDQALQPLSTAGHANLSDQVSYREYLVEVWASVAAQMHKSAPARSQFRQQLNNRFFQDFSTRSEFLEDASTLVAGILVDILGAPKLDGGLGLTPKAIPARGSESSVEYLGILVAASGLPLLELQNRYRISFDRIEGQTTSSVALNIEALIGLLADTFQGDEEPFPANPAVTSGRPLIFGEYIGRAPFFLRYEEWLAQHSPFWAENFYDIRSNLIDWEKQVADTLRQRGTEPLRIASPVANENDNPFKILGNGAADKLKYAGLAARIVEVSATLREAFSKLDARDYRPSLEALEKAKSDLTLVLIDFGSQWRVDGFSWSWEYLGSPRSYSAYVSLRKKRAGANVRNPVELHGFERALALPNVKPYESGESWEDTIGAEVTLAHAILQSFHVGVYYLAVIVPYLRGRIAVELGDKPGAIRAFATLTGIKVGVAEATDTPGYRPPDPYLPPKSTPDLYAEQSLPYTATVGTWSDLTAKFDSSDLDATVQGVLGLHKFEFPFIALQQGAAMLDWADELFKTNSAPLIERARELYKGVIFLHKSDPATRPDFSMVSHKKVQKAVTNPAIDSQIARAKRGLTLIDKGLNVLGFSRDFIPFLRYSTLKAAADRFAQAAKNAQNDLIAFVGQYEEGKVQTWRLQNLLQKAESTKQIATERNAIAKFDLQKAKDAAKAIEDNIVKKQNELKKSTEPFSQATQYIEGLIGALKPMVGDQMTKSFKVEAVGADPSNSSEVALSANREVQGKDLLKIGGAAMTDGYKGAVNQAASSMGAGAGVMGGFGAFWYASYVSMSGMVDAYNKKAGEIKNLQDNVLKEAKDQIRFRERQLTIANAELDIAEADRALARNLLNFERDRILGPETYLRLAALAERLLSRYRELTIYYAWLAERALAFETASEINIVRLDYQTGARLNLGASDLIQAALAELENSRLDHIRLAAPVTHTISMSRDFPLAFGQLKETGQCEFSTLESEIAAHYPGCFNFRLRAVTTFGIDASAQAVRGMLWNSGHSALYDEDGSRRPLVRFPDALPLSEFRLRQDREVFGLPGETLLAFEGSGIETQWYLELPRHENPGGLQALTDVFIVIDCYANFSGRARELQKQRMGSTVSRAVAILASGADMTGLSVLLAGGPKTTLSYDLTRVPLSPAEKNRHVSAIGILLVAFGGRSVSVAARAIKSNVATTPSVISGVSLLSNAAISVGDQPPSELDKLVSLPLEQVFEVSLDLGASPIKPDEIVDVLLYLEYTADRVWP